MKKQARKRTHASRPYQQRLLNMAEARREIVTALKIHRATMRQQQQQGQVAFFRIDEAKRLKKKHLFWRRRATPLPPSPTISCATRLGSGLPPPLLLVATTAHHLFVVLMISHHLRRPPPWVAWISWLAASLRSH